MLGRVSRFLLVAISFVVLAGGSLMLPVVAHAQTQASADAPLFINVTSEDSWKVSMAAFFGTNFALKQGHKPVVMFVNVQAVPFFTKAKADVRNEQFGKTVQEMIKEFQSAGGKVLICPVCMKALKLGDGDLIAGAEVATVKSVNDILFRPDTKTLNW